MKIKFFIMMAVLAAASVFTSCDDEDESAKNIVSEYEVNDKVVAEQKTKSGKDEAVLLVAFGSTWSNSFAAFDATKKAYEAAFPNADVYVCFSSDICINRASAGENGEARDYYEPRYLLHAIGAAKYAKIYVQSLQVIPGEEFANVVACVKKFMNNGYIASAHLDDDYLAKLDADKAIFLGMPLLNTFEGDGNDVDEVAKQLNDVCKDEVAKGVVAFMGHGNPDSYDAFKANVRYTQLQTALQKYSDNYFVGTVDAPNTYKYDVHENMKSAGKTSGDIYLHCLMSIAGDHAHNDMAGQGDEYWGNEDGEDDSWFEYFAHNGYTANVPLGANNEPSGLLEIPGVLNVWINHTKNADFLEDAYHSMYPEE
ncbi:MAG: sirohydrochlorin cobaltochelatase [Bacteroidales bacterium]|nr:sirohydrochlorin cobaltochelatase [Candidatus Scybalocola fimicaballi]